MDRQESYRPGFFDRQLVSFFKWVNKYIPWHKLPPVLGALNLSAFRIELRAKNLHDGYAEGSYQGNRETDPLLDKRYEGARNSDGKFNSLDMPKMGCSGMRFGRNFPRDQCKKPSPEELFTPDPRMLSDVFMKREKFQPATSLNLLAAAWIQFQTHDWFFHDTSPTEHYDIPMKQCGDKWPYGPMKLRKSIPDDENHPSDKQCPGYKNANTSWWDASMIYGSDEKRTAELRDLHQDGKLLLTKDKREQFLPRDKDNNVMTGFNDNWWVGLELLHTLFALEHNSICDAIRTAHPDWTGNQIFDKARLVNCALMAKIHTVEWTPAILAHPTLKLGMNANWWGLAGETITKMIGRVSSSEVISGIPGSKTDQYGVPYSLTEEFVSVYRLHTLLPDTLALFNASNGEYRKKIAIEETIFTKAQDVFDKGQSFADMFYSFGISYPGAVTNHNYPNFLRTLESPDGQQRDLGTVDLLRDRERGVPRYCEFRRMLHMPVPKTFDELVGGNNPELAKKLEKAYDGKIELVDRIIGSHSEPLPKGFGFSDTAFRIFILMASRRLNSDRFITKQWNAQTYTKEGFHWVQHTTMKDVLIRHFPELKDTLKKSKNVFAPWQKMEESKKYTGIETNATYTEPQP